jgi:hypothetical protein
MSPPPGDTGRDSMRNSKDCRNGANRARRHRVNISKYTVLPNFVFIHTRTMRDVQRTASDGKYRDINSARPLCTDMTNKSKEKNTIILKEINFLLHNWIKDETPNTKTQDMITCCVIRAIAHFKGRDRWLCGNGGMVINRVNQRRSKNRPAPSSFCLPRFLREINTVKSR